MDTKKINDMLSRLVHDYYDYVKFATGIHLEDYERSIEQKENLKKLVKFFPPTSADVKKIDEDVIKVWGSLLRDDNNLPKFLAYLEGQKYGWVNNKYVSSNPCEQHCRSNVLKELGIDDIPTAKNSFEAFCDIFFNTKYGWITLILTCYCLTALFKSKLSRAVTPFYLQVACDKKSLVYELLIEITTIFDVNTGIFNECKTWACDYGRCRSIIPNDVTQTLTDLSEFKDTPVVLDGYDGNAHNYKATLRTLNNKSNKRNQFDVDGVLPISFCSDIKSSPHNFFSIDLTAVEIDEDYLKLIKANKVHLTLVVSKLINDFIRCLFPDEAAEYESKKYLENEWRTSLQKEKKAFLEYEFPFSKEIAKSVQSIRGIVKNDKSAKNIGILRFFFIGFLRAFGSVFNDEIFAIQNLATLIERCEKSLIETHERYSPVSLEEIKLEYVGIADKDKKYISKTARRYARDIVRYYLDYGVLISIPKVIIKGERYIFEINLLEGTRQYRLFKDAEEVRVKIGFEYFKPTKQGLEFLIVASKKPLKENSLLKIIGSREFKESKAKIPFAMGYDIMGDRVIEDVADFTHSLFAGSSGSGKSTSLHCLLISLTTQSIDKVNIIVFDFGITYLSQFKDIPHLSHPIITDMPTGVEVINKLKDEMERRRELYKVDRNAFNKLPKIYCVIDEFPKFIRHGEDAKAKKDLENAVTGLLEQSRGVGIYMVLAAQDPTEKKMKCGMTNLGTCLAFRCRKKNNSEVMLGESGAENLLGNGDMLFKCESRVGIRSIQGAYIDEKDIVPTLEKMLEERNFPNEGKYKFNMSKSVVEDKSDVNKNHSAENGFDVDMTKLIMLLLTEGEISSLKVEDDFGMGYRRVRKYMNKLVEYRLIEPLNGNKKARTLLPQNIDDIPEEVIGLLLKNGYTRNDIANAFTNRI